MRGRDALVSSATDEWMTPPEVMARVNRVAPVLLDPCASPTSGLTTGAVIEEVGLAGGDGLAREWSCSWPSGGAGHVFVNPPYSNMGEWAAKVRLEAEAGVPITLLVPARTDTKWFHHVLPVADNVVLWRGRVRFLQPDGTRAAAAPFPSAILTFNLATAGVRSAYLDVAEVLRGPRWR